MVGNVWEWTEGYAMRGGSWFNDAELQRPAPARAAGPPPRIGAAATVFAWRGHLINCGDYTERTNQWWALP